MLTPDSTGVRVIHIKPTWQNLQLPSLTSVPQTAGVDGPVTGPHKPDWMSYFTVWGLAGTPDSRPCEHKRWKLFFLINVGLPCFHMNSGFGDAFNCRLTAGRLLAPAAGAFKTVWTQVKTRPV